MGIQPVLWPHTLLWTGPRAARGKIMSGTPNRLNYCVISVLQKLKIWPRAACVPRAESWRRMAYTLYWHMAVSLIVRILNILYPPAYCGLHNT